MITDSLKLIIESGNIHDSISIVLPDTIKSAVNCCNSCDSSIWSELLKNAATISIALIAGFIALIQVKSNVVSSARIKWIEQLKSLISEFYVVSIDVIYNYREYDEYEKRGLESEEKIKREHFKKYEKDHSTYNKVSNKIKMYLNLKENDHEVLENLIEAIDSKLDPKFISEESQSSIAEILEQITPVAKKIFKTEWDKSKRIFKI